MATKSLAYIVALLMAISCTSTNKNTLYERGVSQELAQQRKGCIKDVEYTLNFNIPQERDSVILGNIRIAFSIEKQQEIIIDYREPNNICSVAANGAQQEYQLLNEHVIIPARATKAGGNSIDISFIAPDQSLNRREDFLYTLLVPDRARTVFPCFDQPDLKANFRLTLQVPQEWTAVSNSPLVGESHSGSTFNGVSNSASTFAEESHSGSTFVVDAIPLSGKGENLSGRKTLSFETTEPLSTYLFSFVAGEFSSETYNDGKHTFTAYHRETDPYRISQLPTIFAQVAASLEWMEEFTGVPYPFAKYDFIILPGFQYGGMEHTGATLYNDNRMFLSKNPTPDEELGRAELIAHETAHMWFGDFVTMQWFNDVWTKEVFANYFAQRITEPLFPGINHKLNWLKSITASALGEDRTLGGTAIRQPLDNLGNAGLVYNNIIYNKAPVMLEKLVELMGEEPFREGIHEYLVKYGYGNATWDNLIAILDSKCDEDLATFSNVWVNSNGMPFMEFTIVKGGHAGDTVAGETVAGETVAGDTGAGDTVAGDTFAGDTLVGDTVAGETVAGDTLVVSQRDPYGRGLCWPQSFKVAVVEQGASSGAVDIDGLEGGTVDDRIAGSKKLSGIREFEVKMSGPECKIALGGEALYVLPNSDGRGYGYFIYDEASLEWVLDNWMKLGDETCRQAQLMNLYEAYQHGAVSAGRFLSSLVAGLPGEVNPLIASTVTGYIGGALVEAGADYGAFVEAGADYGAFVEADADYGAHAHSISEVERELWALAHSHSLISCRKQLMRVLISSASDSFVCDELYKIWESGVHPLLSENDFMTLAYNLALVNPQLQPQIIEVQSARITNPDRKRQFEFIARATTPDTLEQERLFHSLLQAQNRRTEPWALSTLGYLCHRSREAQAVKYIRPALDSLQYIQRTSDIFFPQNWTRTLLGSRYSPDALAQVEKFLADNPDYPPLLRSKILQACWGLQRRNLSQFCTENAPFWAQNYPE